MEHQPVRFVLMGNATLGVPFYRALNAGIKGGIIASTLLADPNNANTQANEQLEQDMQHLGSVNEFLKVANNRSLRTK